MRNMWGVFVAAVAVLIVGILAYNQLSLPRSSEKKAGALTVGATIFPLADMVRQVGGEAVNVVLIIPPGVSEHSLALTPQQVQALSGARAVFQIGQNLDSHLVERITATLPDIRAVSVDRGIALQEFDDGGVDPHYWLTVPNAVIITKTVAETLSQLDPAQAFAFQKNAGNYIQALQTLEADLQEQAKQTARKEFMATHNAWSYFARHYGLQLVATYEPIEGKQPSLADLQRLQTIVNQYRLAAFFAEPQKATSAVTSFMQREFGLQVRTLDPVGGLEGRESYVELMRANMAAIVNSG